MESQCYSYAWKTVGERALWVSQIGINLLSSSANRFELALIGILSMSVSRTVSSLETVQIIKTQNSKARSHCMSKWHLVNALQTVNALNGIVHECKSFGRLSGSQKWPEPLGEFDAFFSLPN